MRGFHWLLTPLLNAGVFLGVGLLLIVAVGFAQRLGWISASSGGIGADSTTDVSKHGRTLTCAMHPQIRQPGSGRCPICGMELVPATENTASRLDELAVHIEPAARRVAGIETATARTMAVERTIRSVGEIAFDESRLATITAWVDGRIERLFADYTGVRVRRGDPLVHLYSPDLYAAQVEYLVARKSAVRDGATPTRSAREINSRLLDDSREKLRELGMTEQQIHKLDESGEAQTRLKVHAPVGGTVIEKSKVEGEYVKTGEIVYRIADLSTVWLLLELFPDDASLIRYGQRVEARVQSLPGEVFSGRVSFIAPVVDKETRTVGVRVDIDNRDGRLRPGDYARATIRVPMTTGGTMYDVELAGKWIGPRHPHMIRDEPGTCPRCDLELIPSSAFGFVEQPVDAHQATVIPRDAVLMAGPHSVVYVEAEPGRFEIRPVTLGPITDPAVPSTSGGGELQPMAVIHDGLEPGEEVATDGNFLIDSQMQLAGKPSLIDPTRARVKQKKKPGPLELEYGQPEQLAGTSGEALDRLYLSYFTIRQRLAADTKPAPTQFSRFSSAVRELQTATDLPQAAQQQIETLQGMGHDLSQGELDEVRRRFKPVSQGIIRLAAQIRGPETAGTLVHFYCPMVQDGGGDWLQTDDETANPYFGSQMLRCGEAVHRLAAVSRASAMRGSSDRQRGRQPVSRTPVPIPVPVPESRSGRSADTKD